MTKSMEENEKKAVARILETSLTSLTIAKQQLEKVTVEKDHLELRLNDAESRCDALRNALNGCQRRCSRHFLAKLREKSNELETLKVTLAKEKGKLRQKTKALQFAKKDYAEKLAEMRLYLNKFKKDAVRARNTLDLIQTDYHNVKNMESGWTTAYLKTKEKSGKIEKQLKNAKTSEIHLRNVLMKQRKNFQVQRNLWKAKLFKSNQLNMKLKKDLAVKSKDLFAKTKDLVTKTKELDRVLQVTNEIGEILMPYYAPNATETPNNPIVVEISDDED